MFVSDWCTVLWAQCAGSVPAATTHCRLLTLTRHPCSRPTLRSLPGRAPLRRNQAPTTRCSMYLQGGFHVRPEAVNVSPRPEMFPSPDAHHPTPCRPQSTPLHHTFAKRQRPLLQKEQRVFSSNRKKPRAPTLSHVRWEARLRPQRDTAAVTLVTYATASADAPVYTQKECRVCSRVGSRHAP